jgi:branched-chain amino acid transport system substrate-binding protein
MAMAMSLLALTGCSLTQAPVTDIVIAADLELTGPMARLGNIYRQALQLRVEQINQSDTLGNRRLVLDVTDNRSDPAVSLANIGEASADPDVSALITGTCDTCLVTAAKAIDSAEIPTISLAVPTAVVQPLGERRYIFKVAPNVPDNAARIVAALGDNQVSAVAIVASDDDYGHEGAAVLQALAERREITVTAQRFVGASGTDLAEIASSVNETEPEAVVLFTFAPLAADVAGALRANGFAGGLYLDAAAADGLYLSAQEVEALRDAFLVFPSALVSEDVIATSPARSARRAWLRDYTSVYGTYSAFGSFAADAIDIIVEAILRTTGSGSSTRSDLRAAIETTSIDGLSGPIRITPDDHSGLRPQALAILEEINGRWSTSR